MSEHIVSPRIYFAIFVALLVLTALTAWVAFYDLGPLNTVVAMSIACGKALLVVLFFMHLRWGGRILWLLVGTAVFWLVILIALIMCDYASRGWLGFPGK